MKNKIIAVVKFNDSEAFVLEKDPELEFTKYGHDTIIGTDGMFYSTYGYESPSKYSKAFAGRKFDLPLKNGEVVKCEGQWWDKVTETAVKELGLTKENRMVYATANSIEKLKKCYVFVGYKTLSNKWDELRKQYTGKVYDYWEYEKLIKENKG